ncbi:MAG TPA: hypothetical protein VFI31_18040 [Pirellulales bacterium]|nr:hypothetical protein [Pirellulales bacterium]
MGLTIHYTFELNDGDEAQARAMVEQLRQKALGASFKEVGEIVEFVGDAADFQGLGKDDPNLWLLCQASRFLERGTTFYRIAPQQVIAFPTLPADGSEPANFGLATYPKTIDTGEEEISTEADGWRWSSFCKTQYASNPNVGGVQNFLRAHLSIVALLDAARDLGLLREVGDEGGYWEKRDVTSLADQVRYWNTAIAGLAGSIKDLLGGAAEAPITNYPNFEHLEADAEKEQS